ncbi:hypothetical protein EIN_184330 [Entamoeba invadens IP1]|uniref:hypothetical protein n=1 Tax=Entamoeba invadens IP1 TaxID=370355 RepID=UPI0002C3E5B2|nr:hypothetical protein EIN_184330 [Entamoeba invadens IP1]ELP94086.1 hypothetical protein EIN_184330 [Entamoeba invadens IP1]|eukprot:XP_004260857.1 hypothetical protein EIN_184330 [Entamoeba invadens IP1]
MLLLLSILFWVSLSSDQVSVDSPCMTGLRGESTKFLGVSGLAGKNSYIQDDCHKFIPNSESLVTAFATHTDCYFAREFFYQKLLGKDYPRCGICVEVIGPTLKRATCTLVGSVVMNFTNPLTMVEDINAHSRTIFLNDQLYKFLGGYSTSDNVGHTFPAVARIVNCPFKTLPSAVVTSITETDGEKSAKISLFNTNQATSKIELLDTIYQYDSDLQFTIPVTKLPKNSFLKVFNLLGGHVNIPFEFVTNKTFSSSTVPLDYFKPQECSLIINEGITPKEQDDDPLMVWTLRVHDNDNISNSHIVEDLKNITIDKEIYVSLSFPFPVRISKHFKSFRTVFTTSVPIGPNVEMTLYAFGSDISTIKELKCSHDFVYNRSFEILENGGIYIDSSASFNLARCNSQINALMMHYRSPMKGTISVYSLSFKQEYPLNFTKCPTTTFQCEDNIQCDPTNSEVEDVSGIEVLYQSGCVPYCGVCKSDEVCSKAARCVKRTTKNTRDGVFGVFIMSILCILFCI